MVLISPKGNALVRNTPQGVFWPPFSSARSTKLITVSRSSGDILLTFNIIDSKASWTKNHKTKLFFCYHPIHKQLLDLSSDSLRGRPHVHLENIWKLF